jgi:hypothetical protein
VQELNDRTIDSVACKEGVRVPLQAPGSTLSSLLELDLSFRRSLWSFRRNTWKVVFEVYL